MCVFYTPFPFGMFAFQNGFLNFTMKADCRSIPKEQERLSRLNREVVCLDDGHFSNAFWCVYVCTCVCACMCVMCVHFCVYAFWCLHSCLANRLKNMIAI